MVRIRISLLTSPELEILVIWSPGHVGIIGNEKADKMAEQGTRLESVALGGGLSRTPNNSPRPRVQQIRREDWEGSHKSSGFDTADINPPTVKPNKVFKETGRELYGRVTQALTGHGYIGEYYRRYIPSTPDP